MEDPRDLDLEHQRRLRAERVLTMLRELWGDDLPPGPNGELAVLIDAIAVDDDHGADDQLITQRDGLTYAMVAELITHYRPDSAAGSATDSATEPTSNSATPSDVASPPASSPFELHPRLKGVFRDLHLLDTAPGFPVTPGSPTTPGAPDVEQFAPAAAAEPAGRAETVKSLKPAQIGMWEIDPQTGDVAYDGVSAQLLGIGTEAGHSTVTQHLNELVHPADRDRVDEAIKYALSTQTTYRVRFRVITALGIPTWLISQGRVLNKPSDPSARLTGYLTLASQPQQREAELIDLP